MRRAVERASQRDPLHLKVRLSRISFLRQRSSPVRAETAAFGQAGLGRAANQSGPAPQGRSRAAERGPRLFGEEPPASEIASAYVHRHRALQR